jgi:radical SAM protein with 4Fe4S-binding SPASM domain
MALPTARGALHALTHHHLYVEHLIAKKLRFFARNRWMARHATDGGDVPAPLVYKLVLTYRCNLRCPMCYEWGATGWCHDDRALAAEELAWPVVEKIFAQSSAARPSFILIGGEPLLYSRFADLARLLREHRSFAITCTNGLLAERMRDSSEDNPYLTYLISLDGLQPENDRIRGAGVYAKVMHTINTLKRLRRPPYIGIQFTLRPENVSSIHRFCGEMASVGVDWVLLNLSWFVTPREATAYEALMRTRFGITATSQRGYQQPFEIDADEFVRQYRGVLEERWDMQVSCYLKRPEDIHAYLADDDSSGFVPCSKQWLRMDVTPNAEVTPCALYPDLGVGNLADSDVMEVWNSERYRDFRAFRADHMLPVCRKCDALYLYDAKRRIL